MAFSIKRALISVSDKTGIVPFAKFLVSQKVELISTGGTARILREAGLKIKEVHELTSFPEIMDGRVKSLHPIIHGGLLALRDSEDHEQAMIEHKIMPIDLLVVNLYPFEATVSNGESFSNCIENIDIGGPALIRAGAKNHSFVTVVVDPKDYEGVVSELMANDGATSESVRLNLAAKAFSITGAYDGVIGEWFNKQINVNFPHCHILGGYLKQKLRYGENPHQQAAFYTTKEGGPGVATAKQLQGKELSFNNLNDTNAAFELVSEYSEKAACVIVKHSNPCGVALGKNLSDAYKKALRCDTESAFGGVIAFNRSVDACTAKACVELFAEVIIAPDIEKKALQIFTAKENLRLLITNKMPERGAHVREIKPLTGGYLLQDKDDKLDFEFKVVTKRKPTEKEILDLKFAFIVAKHVKSNAIVYAKNEATVGVGAGQMSRVNASRIAGWKAADAARVAGDTESWAVGSVVASDAFFPFADGLLAAAESGVRAVIQPGGSIRDKDVISAADKAGLSMVFTGMRHFKH